jgi:hypothetical protein
MLERQIKAALPPSIKTNSPFAAEETALKRATY